MSYRITPFEVLSSDRRVGDLHRDREQLSYVTPRGYAPVVHKKMAPRGRVSPSVSYVYEEDSGSVVPKKPASKGGTVSWT